MELLTGLITGIAFGFLLRKGHLTRFSVIVNQLRLKDFTVMKVMMTAVLSSGAGFAILCYLQPETVPLIDKTTLFATAVGGGIFGVGMAIVGYCPGTGIGAIADGAKDMWFGLLGMIVGAGIYAESYAWIEQTIKPESEMMNITLPEFFGIPAWLILCPLILLASIFVKKQPKVA